MELLKPVLTQRAYTLKLVGQKGDNSWREALWKTHEAVNIGAKVFGDWLLTLRGGLSHELAEEKDLTNEQKKYRMILLALSWLTVESEDGANKKYIVTKTEENENERKSKLEEALKEILQERKIGKKQIECWLEICLPILASSIREKSVWINRSKMFDDAKNEIGNSLDREAAWDIFDLLFGGKKSYFQVDMGAESAKGDTIKTTKIEKVKDLSQKAGQWLSRRFGTGKGANFKDIGRVCEIISKWANENKPMQFREMIEKLSLKLKTKTKDVPGILSLMSARGYKSATRNWFDKNAKKNNLSKEDLKELKEKSDEDARKCKSKIGAKGKLEWSDKIMDDVNKSERGLSYIDLQSGNANHFEISVILDHAMRHLSQTHSWIKIALEEKKAFKENADKLQSVSNKAQTWLDSYCEDRSEQSGAIEEYRIRKSAIGGWKEVVKAWENDECKTTEDRIKIARELQDELEDKKFGDINLFTDLAEDDAKSVWQENGKPNCEILENYVEAKEAEFKQKHFKIPAYRHPDPLLHPVFCDFGKSRWKIDFSAHNTTMEADVKKMERDINEIEVELKKCKEIIDDKKADKVKASIAELEKKRSKTTFELKYLQNKHSLRLGLWDGRAFLDKIELFWQSKRLENDIVLKDSGQGEDAIVTRADRAGRSVGNASKESKIQILNVFEEKDWNGRLQTPRVQLERLSKCKSAKKANKLKNNIKWFISFSPKLQPQGPWIEYVNKNNVKVDKRYFNPYVEENKKRKGQARLVLSRLPGLRILSVDLGHRYAAACAVWQAISKKEIESMCKQMVNPVPKEDDLFLRIKVKTPEGKKKTVIYRRIGPDKLNGQEHPAPWARLDRQFLIKLQGEDVSPRMVSKLENKLMSEIENDIGYQRDDELHPVGNGIDDVMTHCMDIIRNGIKRHSEYAKISFGLLQKRKLLSGARIAEENMTKNERTEHIQDLLEKWDRLAYSNRWKDKRISDLWEGLKFPELSSEKENETSQERKQRESQNKSALSENAKELINDNDKCLKLSKTWAEFWKEDDIKWRKILGNVRKWILPDRKMFNKNKLFNVGGLSLTRIANIKSLYRVQKAFFTRVTPDRKNMNEAKEGFGQSVLDTLESMSENRVKQLASRIIEAALGIGSENKDHWKGNKRPLQRINDPRFAPCHAVIIENLSNYRPDEVRTRRENRQLMDWSASNMEDYLHDACELNGLYLRQVYAGYTSKQDSRTGDPGIRCQDISVEELSRGNSWAVKNAQKKHSQNKDDCVTRYILELVEKWKKAGKKEKENTFVRIPQRGGEIFVSSNPESPASKGLQADLNAAANIGLKAIIDPDWPGKWWYVLCKKDGSVLKEKTEGSLVFDEKDKLKVTEDEIKTKKDSINLWRNISSKPLTQGAWMGHEKYNDEVVKNVVNILRKDAGLKAEQ